MTTEPPPYKLPHHGAFLIGAGVGALALVVCLFVLPAYAVAIGANAMFACYLGITAWEFHCFTPAFLKKKAADTDTPVLAIFGVTLIVVVVAVLFLFLAVNEDGQLNLLAIGASAVSVVLGCSPSTPWPPSTTPTNTTMCPKRAGSRADCRWPRVSRQQRA